MGKENSVAAILLQCCLKCPCCRSERTPRSGYAMDYICSATTPPRIVAGYVEWDSQLPKTIPFWCPNLVPDHIVTRINEYHLVHQQDVKTQAEEEEKERLRVEKEKDLEEARRLIAKWE